MIGGMMTDQQPVHRVRPLSFHMELRLLVEHHRRILRKLEADQEIYPDVSKEDDNGEEPGKGS